MQMYQQKIVLNQNAQDEFWSVNKISSAMKIVAQIVFPKKIFTSSKVGAGIKAVCEAVSVFHSSCLWQSIKAINCGPLPDAELLFF